ncbi:MAG TPA: hypothetical protein VME63_18310 [Dyella sp.]|uniref:hypothetical protein n=1 Tax=Dyella sp. TaxID=1869338 RepID=UPI002C6E922F|nr:hypothetical protein [Dyella sp.]HTV87354.1 hypothetical protein [Dyella sp.]
MGFNGIKKKVISNLLTGNFVHEARNDIDVKNLLSANQISIQQAVEILKKCRGNEHTQSPHHLDSSVSVNIIKSQGWYIKFYFDSDTVFISFH